MGKGREGGRALSAQAAGVETLRPEMRPLHTTPLSLPGARAIPHRGLAQYTQLASLQLQTAGHVPADKTPLQRSYAGRQQIKRTNDQQVTSAFSSLLFIIHGKGLDSILIQNGEKILSP